ncbi:MAG: threonine synthase [Firmicutes bacterium]|nr:threonine synthase [Bacillota bacterium]MCL5039838.1 threonine synthase [Bacillota bacterium]
MYLTHLECPKCGRTHDANQVQNLCQCGAPLLARYDLEKIKSTVKKEDLTGRAKSLWRYREFLPVQKDENIVTLGEGCTPLLRADTLGRTLGLSQLYIKDEGLNPTGTFKARGAAVGVSRAKELGIETVAMPTAGNAGGAWSAYTARAGLRSVVVMPVDAPDMAKKETFLNGARTYLVQGLISDAGKIVGRGVKRYGWFDASTLKEPYRIEGKKTMGLEIAEQFHWDVPDVILYPAGGGVGLIGIWKALEEMAAIGWISGKRPRMVAVQAEGCSPLVKAFREGRQESEFHQNAQTLAGGIRVPKALGDFLVLEAIYKSGGAAIDVSDAEILEALRLTARSEGMFICPEGAATIAAIQKMKAASLVDKDERILLLNTGTGLKYPETVEIDLPVLGAADDIVL